MVDDDRLRVGGWVNQGDVPHQAPPGAGATGWESAVRPDASPADGATAGDRASDNPTVGIEVVPRGSGGKGDDYRGHRRAEGERVTLRRLLAVGIMVAAVLVGVGVLAQSLSPGPEAPPAPPATPEGGTGPTVGIDRLAPAPSAPATVPTTPAPTAPAGGEDAGGQDGAEPTTPTPTSPPTTAPIVSYESEGAELGGHTRVRPLDGASGGEVVEFTSGSPKADVIHTGVSAGRSGRYRLTIVYYAAGPQGVEVVVNGEATAVSLEAPDGPDTAGTVTLSVNLSADGNTVEIRNSDGPGLKLDRITIAE